MRNKSRKQGAAAISNLYTRMETHERAIKYGFVFKALPMSIAATILFLVGVRTFAMGTDPAYAAMHVLVSALTAIVIYLFWQNDVLRTTIVHMI